MNINLHGTVRGAINSVSQDILMQYVQSTGNTVDSNGTATPTYATAVPIRGNVQPIGGEDLRKFPFLQDERIHRAVYCYGAIQGIVRLTGRGGDLLQFTDPSIAPTVATWLITAVDETWGPGWCRVIATLQLDPNNAVT